MIWAHIRSVAGTTARYATIASVSIFGAVCVAQMCHVLVVNRLFLRGLPRAQAAVKSNIVRVTVDVPIALTVYPGQHVNVCLPGVSWSSMLQSHPFIIVSARRHGDRTLLELVIQARRGWTSRLHHRALRDRNPADDHPTIYRCLFSGPHGPRRTISQYGVVVLVASGWGVIGLLPYLQGLVHGYNNFTTKARRIHLIWQLHDAGELGPVSLRHVRTDAVVR